MNVSAYIKHVTQTGNLFVEKMLVTCIFSYAFKSVFLFSPDLQKPGLRGRGLLYQIPPIQISSFSVQYSQNLVRMFLFDISRIRVILCRELLQLCCNSFENLYKHWSHTKVFTIHDFEVPAPYGLRNTSP